MEIRLYEPSELILDSVNEYDESKKLYKLIGETLGCALLDTGCSKTVCSKTRFDEYSQTLTEIDRSKVQYMASETLFRFEDGNIHKAIKKVKIPVVIGKKKILINADIVNSEIPLLLSKDTMKKSGTFIDLQNDKVTMFGMDMKLFLTRKGNYCIGLNKKVNIGRDNNSSNFVFVNCVEKLLIKIIKR